MIEESEWSPIGEVSPIVRRHFEPEKDVDYIEIGIRSFGNGTFQKPPVKGKLIDHKNLYKMNEGDLVFSNVFSWEGAIALASKKDDVCIGSHRFITTVPDKQKVHPEFILYHLLSPKGMEDINKASPGSAGRNKTLGMTKLEKILVPVPDIEKQNDFVKLLHKVNAINEFGKESELELKVLFPSVLDKAFKGEW